MSIESMFKTDKEKENSGIWIDYGTEMVKITRAGSNNQKYRKTFSELTKPYESQIQMDLLPEDVGEKILKETYAKAIVVGWKVFVDGEWIENKMFVNGKVENFTADNVFSHFMNFNDFFLDIKRMSEKMSIFREKQIEETVGN